MARTTTGSDADDDVVDRGPAPEDETADAGATEPSRPTKRGRLGRRGKAAKKDDAPPATEQGTAAATAVDLDKPGSAGGPKEAGKPGKPGKTGESGKMGKPGKAGKAGKARDKRPVLSGAARLARVVTVLGMVALILAVVLVVQLVKGPGDGAGRAEQEDRKEAARSAAEVAVARLFSFDYKSLDADFAAQRAVTTGEFTGEIEKVTNPAVRPLATKEHVVVQAVSVASATVDDPGPDVQVIIFLNQAVTLDLLPAPRLDRNRVLASMRFVDGQWKVAGVKAL